MASLLESYVAQGYALKEGFLSQGHANGSLLDSEHMPILTGFEAAVFISGKFLSKDVEITSLEAWI